MVTRSVTYSNTNIIVPLSCGLGIDLFSLVLIFFCPCTLPSLLPSHRPSLPLHSSFSPIIPPCVSSHSPPFCLSLLPQTLHDRLGVRCVLGLTATATHTTGLSVARQLGVAEENIVWGAGLPENLHVSVSCDEDRDLVRHIHGYCVCKLCIFHTHTCTEQNMARKVEIELFPNHFYM